MIESTPKSRKAAFALIGYIRQGRDHVCEVEDSYFSSQRMGVIGNRLKALLGENTSEKSTVEDSEASYLRLCDRYSVCHIVTLGDWKNLLELIASRIHFYASNNLGMSSIQALMLKRIWLVSRALHTGK